MAQCTLYSGRSVLVTINNRRITGLSDDNDAVVVEPNEDIAEIKEGMSGAAQINLKGSKLVTIKMKVFATSPDHKFLQGIARDLKNGICHGLEGSVVDTSSGEGGTSDEGTIIKEPSKTYGKGADGVREWEFAFANWDDSGVDFDE